MKFRVTYIATIDDQELTDAGILDADLETIEDYFFSQGGEATWHDHGESFEIIR
jgi:hypothetical protein